MRRPRLLSITLTSVGHYAGRPGQLPPARAAFRVKLAPAPGDGIKSPGGRRSVVGYDGELASEWLPVRTLPCVTRAEAAPVRCGHTVRGPWLFNLIKIAGQSPTFFENSI